MQERWESIVPSSYIKGYSDKKASEFIKNNYDQFSLRVPKGDREKYKKLAVCTMKTNENKFRAFQTLGKSGCQASATSLASEFFRELIPSTNFKTTISKKNKISV